MAIPKTIYQTFKTAKLPFINRWHINSFRKKNPSYKYEFYTDERIAEFLKNEYGREVIDAYKRIQIGAAKADFFRYAILYKKGGIYLDIDSTIKKDLDEFIKPDDKAIISLERNPGIYVQWALIYEAGHQFLEKTLELVLANIAENKYPHDVHQMSGPSVYTKAINECLEKNPAIPHRVLGIDYNSYLKFKLPLAKLIYAKGEHWKEQQKTKPVLKPI
ncbi:MAG: glycosyl transferase [Chitinophagaceae bacterium]|nr:glycosyl transferase [Chitinophagaceae bacterium]